MRFYLVLLPIAGFNIVPIVAQGYGNRGKICYNLPEAQAYCRGSEEWGRYVRDLTNCAFQN
ncbi:hypothetical protein FE257_011012 [Aspergillus nanangensis]|uniref:Uncharacterized protein n=1 Tax=Aspergillus nanangensis TaxID=2582783 RepID=A0AAD4GQZ8_ASPNN|nr:hypothetical protein FE257_011012 [Aspergillus nanangensis]